MATSASLVSLPAAPAAEPPLRLREVGGMRQWIVVLSARRQRDGLPTVRLSALP